MKVVVIDYQLGNISSIINMLRKIGIEAIHSDKQADIQVADKLILPGVGAFDHGVKHLHESGLIKILNEEVIVKKKPVLGICLGMQLLLDESEEGQAKGLGWIKGRCVKFSLAREDQHLKVPHMGWSHVTSANHNHSLQAGADEQTRYYFVHSYHAVCENSNHVLGEATHGYPFPAIIGRDNIFGAQFHPEKSHKYGMNFLKNFIEFELCSELV